MRMKLLKIKIKNFKLFSEFTFEPNGNNVEIAGANGKGKTTIKETLTWLHFDKDAEGNTKFGYRPKDATGKVIDGLTVSVEATWLIDGVIHTFRRDEVERIAKEQTVGYTSNYWINEEPIKRERDFKEYFENIIPEEKFRILTDLDYFNNDDKNKWQERRRILEDMAGNIPEPAGFEDVEQGRGQLTIDGYKKVLKEKKAGYEKEKETNTTRLDEKHLDLTQYAQSTIDSQPELIAKRDILHEKIDGLNKQRNELLENEKKRQEINDKINHLTVERLHRENYLKNRSGRTDELIDEKNKLEADHEEKVKGLVDIHKNVQTLKMNIESLQNMIDKKLLLRKSIQDEYRQADSLNCSLCGQAWPEDKPKPGLVDIEKRGNRVQVEIEKCKTEKADMENALQVAIAAETTEVEELKAAEAEKNKKIEAINEQIKNRPEPDVSQDVTWKELTAQIDKLLAERGEPASEQLSKIEAETKNLSKEMAGLNETLAQFDTIEKTKARIVELTEKQKELSQLLADIQKKVVRVEEYEAAKNNMIQIAVNGLFRHVEFQLFDYFLNEGYKPVCVCRLDGRPYKDLSGGEKIFADIDVHNALSDYYGVECPFFLDNAERLSLDFESDSQVIKLRVEKEAVELVIKTEEAVA